MTKQYKNKPEFILTFSEKKTTPEQDLELVSEFVFTLLRWQAKELQQTKAS